MESTSVFDDPSLLPPAEHATTGERFVHYLVDSLAIGSGLQFVIGYALGLALGTAGGSEWLGDLLSSKGGEILFNYLFGAVVMIPTYTVLERYNRGRTVGKMITGTAARRTDGGALTLHDAFLRSLVRFVPFDALSALTGHPWHDAWTDTEVVKLQPTVIS